MKKHLLAIVCSLSASILLAHVYVSPAGDDAADGSEMRPFCTLTRAQQAMRGQTGEIRVADGSSYSCRGTNGSRVGFISVGTVGSKYWIDDFRLSD